MCLVHPLLFFMLFMISCTVLWSREDNFSGHKPCCSPSVGSLYLPSRTIFCGLASTPIVSSNVFTSSLSFVLRTSEFFSLLSGTW